MINPKRWATSFILANTGNIVHNQSRPKQNSSQWSALVTADEQYAWSTLQSLQDAANTAKDYEQLDRAQRLLALGTRLFGGFRRDVTLEYLPPCWEKNERPREPFGYERTIEQLMEAAVHRNIISEHGECTYWFCRVAIFAAFEDVERILDGASANRDLSAQFADVEKLASDIQSKLFSLQVALEALQLVDVPEKTFPIQLIEDESLAKRHRERADEHLWRFKSSYRLHELMDPRQISHIAEWCRALEEESERLKFETRNPAGAPARFDRLYFMHVAGLLWLFITGAAPTQSNNTFMDFLDSCESVFWNEEPGTDVRNRANTVAANFASWEVRVPEDIPFAGRGLQDAFAALCAHVEAQLFAQYR